jgi:hypothetical protein
MSPPHTPTKPKRHEYSTPERTRFIYTWQNRKDSQSLPDIIRNSRLSISRPTARKWIQEYQSLGSPALRRKRRDSTKIGRPKKTSVQQLEAILSPSHQSHNLNYAQMVEEEGFNCHPKTLERAFRAIKAKHFKKKRSAKISEKNKTERVEYGRIHKTKPIRSYWKYIYYTDEAHFNTKDLSNKREYDLHKEGDDRAFDFIEETDTQIQDFTVHVAAGISYNGKGAFQFYNDPKDKPLIREYKATGPRKTKDETAKEYAQRLSQWRAYQPAHEPEIKQSGNSMTQAFYRDSILPYHIAHIRDLERRTKHKIYFEEDGDPSHGKKTQNNIVQQAREDAHLIAHEHTAQSPDLVPMEGIWLIIKQRLRGGRWKTVEEFKAAILREWRRITIKQIRDRISEMPKRCEKVEKLKGARIKGKKW